MERDRTTVRVPWTFDRLLDMTVGFRIDRLKVDSEELPVVASRMRDTLVEVLGDEIGRSMYSLAWILDRATSHLDGRFSGAIYIARHGPTDANVGHVVLRREKDELGEFGLVSTIYVSPEVRRQGVATILLDAAHEWFADRGLKRTATDTSETNRPLIELYQRRGYALSDHDKARRMVRLSRDLPT